MKPSSFKVASIQLNSQDNINNNLAHIKSAISTASEHHAKLIVLPENACLMGNQTPLAKRFDEMCDWYAMLAQQYNVHLVAGTLPSPIRPNGSAVANNKYRQSSLLFDNTGNLLARYDKLHLFRAKVADGVGSYDEGRTFEAGDELVVAHCVIDGISVNIGMMVCFDVRFANMAHQLRRLGADILTIPAAFTYTTGKAHWQTLLQARALDSQCLILGATQGGIHHYHHKGNSYQRQTWGHAMMVDANGQIVASTHRTDTSKQGYEIIYTHYDAILQQRIRQAMPLISCHRSENISSSI